MLDLSPDQMSPSSQEASLGISELDQLDQLDHAVKTAVLSSAQPSLAAPVAHHQSDEEHPEPQELYIPLTEDLKTSPPTGSHSLPAAVAAVTASLEAAKTAQHHLQRARDEAMARARHEILELQRKLLGRP